MQFLTGPLSTCFAYSVRTKESMLVLKSMQSIYISD